MPYHRWLQFLRQQSSLRVQQYHTRATSHSHWLNFNTYLPAEAAVLLTVEAWMQNTAAGLQIQVNGAAAELLEAIRGYGAMLEGSLTHTPPPIRHTAVGAVIYDVGRDRLYYGVSGFNASIARMNVHAVLTAGSRPCPWSCRTEVEPRYGSGPRALARSTRPSTEHCWTGPVSGICMSGPSGQAT